MYTYEPPPCSLNPETMMIPVDLPPETMAVLNTCPARGGLRMMVPGWCVGVHCVHTLRKELRTMLCPCAGGEVRPVLP